MLVSARIWGRGWLLVGLRGLGGGAVELGLRLLLMGLGGLVVREWVG